MQIYISYLHMAYLTAQLFSYLYILNETRTINVAHLSILIYDDDDEFMCEQFVDWSIIISLLDLFFLLLNLPISCTFIQYMGVQYA